MTKAAVWLGDPVEDREWVDVLTPLLPGIEVVPTTGAGSPGVDYAVVWAPPEGAVARQSDLKAIVSVGAGVDHVLRDPELPRHLPIQRTTRPDMVQRLREHVAMHLLAHHRDLMTTDAQQRRLEWKQLVTPVAGGPRVGVMGSGRIGAACAKTLAGLGFDTARGRATRIRSTGSRPSMALKVCPSSWRVPKSAFACCR